MKCLNCKTPTTKWGDRHKLYCNVKCRDLYYSKKNKKHYKEKRCEICNKEFKPNNIRGKCCSRKCSRQAYLLAIRKKPFIKKCQYCEKEFKPYTSLDKFCSANCRIANQKSKRKWNWSKKSCNNRTGKLNPAYKNGDRVRTKKTSAIEHRKYLRIRNKIRQAKIEKYGFLFCDRCETNNSYQWEMHHLIYKSEKPKHKYLHNERNLIDLCMKCHNWFHQKKDRRNYLIKERNLIALFGNDILSKKIALQEHHEQAHAGKWTKQELIDLNNKN